MCLKNGYLTFEELQKEAGKSIEVEKITNLTDPAIVQEIVDFGMDVPKAFCTWFDELWASQSASPKHDSAIWERIATT